MTAREHASRHQTLAGRGPSTRERLAADAMARRVTISAALLGVLLTLGFAARAGEQVAVPSDCPSPGETTGRVADIVDGNTLLLDSGLVLRLAGIDAPERPLDLGDGKPWPLAGQARDRLAALAKGETIRLATVGSERDRHGRAHGFAYLAGGELLQADLVGEGLARVHAIPGESACAATLLARERLARKARRGLWASRDFAVRRADDSSLLDQIGLYELVEGRVTSIGRGSRLVFLDFGRDWRRDFTVMMALPVADSLAAAGTPVEALVKHVIRVRGIIEESGGPAIRIEDPNGIELLDKE
jgi:micrococcal nuclease